MSIVYSEDGPIIELGGAQNKPKLKPLYSREEDAPTGSGLTKRSAGTERSAAGLTSRWAMEQRALMSARNEDVAASDPRKAGW
eukprot:2212253-Prymnesium_polylepis.1